jgi:hypothetical protein
MITLLPPLRGGAELSARRAAKFGGDHLSRRR